MAGNHEESDLFAGGADRLRDVGPPASLLGGEWGDVDDRYRIASTWVRRLLHPVHLRSAYERHA